VTPSVESEAPKVCLYCDGEGNGSAGPCGFCDKGKPLDTQEDWDNSWGRTFRRKAEHNDGFADHSEQETTNNG
jgi:hypothetical protein